MNFGQALMRFLSPTCERQRQEFRQTMARTSAHAEDLTRTILLPATLQADKTISFAAKGKA